MFTGIVEEVGTIRGLNINGHSGNIDIQANIVTEDAKLGDSIAVNGICLTVTSLKSDGFTADVMAETVRRSSLKEAKVGSSVNLERAMAANGRFGGHIVSGHIDGVGTITEYKSEENAIWVTITTSDEILMGIVEKGSICIDGISLTVAYIDEKCFKVSIIPHTAKNTILVKKKVGDLVNLENDIVGKYVQRLMNFESNSSKKSSLTLEMLANLEY